eukprot:33858_1
MADIASATDQKKDELECHDIDDILNEIEQRPTPNYSHVDWNEIEFAIKNNNTAFIKHLISSNDINIDAQHPSTGMTLLMQAVVVGSMDLVKIILNFGANVKITDHDNESALDYAIKYGIYKISELLYYQQLSGELGASMKTLATKLHHKNHEAQYFMDSIGDTTLQNSSDLFGIVSGSTTIKFNEFMDNFIIKHLCNAMDKREEFSGDLLYYSWYYITHKQPNPLESTLFKSIIKAFEQIISNTKDRSGWKFLKEQFIDNLIWYTTDHKQKVDDKTEITLEDTLFYELFCRVQQESKKQGDLLLKNEMEQIKTQQPDLWHQLVSFNVATKYSIANNARQDDCGCLTAKYTESELLKYPSSTTFNATKHYDSNIYLNELLFRAGQLNESFQRDVKLLSKQIANEIGGNVMYRAGPLKTMERSRSKIENDYIDAQFPKSAKILDINRCALQFESIDVLMQFLEKLRERIETKNAYCINQIIRCKNGWMDWNQPMQNPSYSDIKLNVLIQTSDGKQIIAEIQFLLHLMSGFKKVAHKLYSIERRAEFVDNFVDLRNNMNKFKNNKNILHVLNDLIENDHIKQFKLFWELSQYINADTLTDIVLAIISKKGQIFEWLTNENNIKIYHESIQQYIPKYGFVHMINAIGIDHAIEFLPKLFASLDGNRDLQKEIFFAKQEIDNSQYTLIDWLCVNEVDGKALFVFLYQYLVKLCASDEENVLFLNALKSNYTLHVVCKYGLIDILNEILNHQSLNKSDIIELLSVHLRIGALYVWRGATPLHFACRGPGATAVQMTQAILDLPFLDYNVKKTLLMMNPRGCYYGTPFEHAIKQPTTCAELLFNALQTDEDKREMVYQSGNIQNAITTYASQNPDAREPHVFDRIGLIIKCIPDDSKVAMIRHAMPVLGQLGDIEVMRSVFAYVNSTSLIQDLILDQNLPKYYLSGRSTVRIAGLWEALKVGNFKLCTEFLTYFKEDQQRLYDFLLEESASNDEDDYKQHFLRIWYTNFKPTTPNEDRLRMIQCIFDIIQDNDKLSTLFCIRKPSDQYTCLYGTGAGVGSPRLELILQRLELFNAQQIHDLLTSVCGTCFRTAYATLIGLCMDRIWEWDANSKGETRFNQENTNYYKFERLLPVIHKCKALEKIFTTLDIDQMEKRFPGSVKIIDCCMEYIELIEHEDEQKESSFNSLALVGACYLNDGHFVEQSLSLIKQSSEWKTYDSLTDVKPPWLIAAQRGYVPIFQAIVGKLKDDKELLVAILSQKYQRTETNCLLEACLHGHSAIVQEILKCDAGDAVVNATYKDGMSCLMRAVKNGDNQTVDVLLKSIENEVTKSKLIAYRTRKRETFLFHISSSTNVECVQSILNHINNQDEMIGLAFVKNKQNKTFLYYFTKYPDLYGIISFVLNALDEDKKLDLLCVKSNTGRSVLMENFVFGSGVNDENEGFVDGKDAELFFETILSNFGDHKSKVYLLNGDKDRLGKTCYKHAQNTDREHLKNMHKHIAQILSI